MPDALSPDQPDAARRRARLMSTILFVCLHNAGRSQMSSALFERAAQGRRTTRDEIARRITELLETLAPG